MPSHLTQNIFRQFTNTALYGDIATSQLPRVAFCSRRPHSLSGSSRRPHIRCSARAAQQCRTILGLPDLIPRGEQDSPLPAHSGGTDRQQLRRASKRAPLPETSEDARREATYEPGYNVLIDFHKAVELGHRPPPAGQVAKALMTFVHYRRRRGRVEEAHADVIYRAFVWLKEWVGVERKYLVEKEIKDLKELGRKMNQETEQAMFVSGLADADGTLSWEAELDIQADDFQAALSLMTQPAPATFQPKTFAHIRLAKFLFEERERMRLERAEARVQRPVTGPRSRGWKSWLGMRQGNQDDAYQAEALVQFSEQDQRLADQADKDLVSYIETLALYGDASKARGLVLEAYDRVKGSRRSLWLIVVRGLIREGRSKEVEELIGQMQERGVPFDNKVHDQLVYFYAQQKGDLALTKKWYHTPIVEGRSPSPQATEAALRLCIKERESDWGDTILKAALKSNPDHQPLWDTLLVWAAVQGRGVEDIEKMMQVNVRENQARSQSLPSIRSINGLVEYANSQNDAYTAERYIYLGEKLGFKPTKETHLLQLDYRIKVKDTTGALVVLKALTDRGVEVDASYINGLVCAMCLKGHDIETINALTDELIARKAPFEAATLAALVGLHLRRAELDDTHDLIAANAFTVGTEGRELVRQELTRFICTPGVAEVPAWSAYMFLKTFFEETSIETRVDIMQVFFDRGRPDLGTQVFGHMRGTQTRSMKPSPEVYAKCLVGIAKWEHAPSLRLVQNLFVLDSNLEPSTKTSNAFLLAYTMCGDSDRALEHWDDIVRSDEGPTYSSIQLAFRACELDQRGGDRAKSIWKRLKQDDIEITRDLYASYIGALAGDGLYDDCVRLCDDARDEGFTVDGIILGTFYNALRSPDARERMQEWAKEKYTAAYDELMKFNTVSVVKNDPTIPRETQDLLGMETETFFDIGFMGRPEAAP